MTGRRVLGAGLSGLTAAINLTLKGESVTVHESRAAPGKHMHAQYQVLLRTGGDAADYLARWNLHPDYTLRNFTDFLCLTNTRDVQLSFTEPLPFVLRGDDPGALENGLYQQAEADGVRFEFNSRIKPQAGDIVATGHHRADMAAFGAYFENSDFPRDRFVYMHDDRYSPRGWYLYLVPIGKDRVKIVNCASRPHLKLVKPLFYRAIEERQALADIVDGAKPLETFGGVGGAHFPRSAVIDGAYHTGEAAGFQDPWRGFGMNYAIESGYLAAQALTDGSDYDRLWKAQFRKFKRLDIARRGIFWVFGNKAFEYAFKRYEDGDPVNFQDVNLKGLRGELMLSFFYRLELMRKWVKGYW